MKKILITLLVFIMSLNALTGCSYKNVSGKEIAGVIKQINDSSNTYRSENKSVGIMYSIEGGKCIDREGVGVERVANTPFSYEDGLNRWSNEKYFYCKSDYTLKVSRNNEAVVDLIDLSEAADENFVFSSSLSRIMYLANYDYEMCVGDLMLYIDGIGVEKIASNVPKYGFVFGENEDEILYVSDYVLKNLDGWINGIGRLYFKHIEKEPVEVGLDASLPIYVNDGGDVLYYEVIGSESLGKTYDPPDMYVGNLGGESRFIHSNVRTVRVNRNGGILICDENEKLHYTKGGSEPFEVTGVNDVSYVHNFDEYNSIYGFLYKVYENEWRGYVANVEVDSFTLCYNDTSNESAYLWVEGFEPKKITDSRLRSDFIKMSQDGTQFYYYDYFDDDTLYLREISDDGVSDEILFSEDIYDFDISADNKHMALYNDEGIFYKNPKGKLSKVGEECLTLAIVGDTIYYLYINRKDTGDEYELYYSIKGGEPVFIDDNINYFRIYNSDTIYYISRDDEIFKFKIGEEVEFVNDGWTFDLLYKESF